MIDLDIHCPGCGVLLTLYNCGGYGAYCETCVEKIPEFPTAPAGTGFVLQGKYPDFYWTVSAPATQLTQSESVTDSGDIVSFYDEDIPQ